MSGLAVLLRLTGQIHRSGRYLRVQADLGASAGQAFTAVMRQTPASVNRTAVVSAHPGSRGGPTVRITGPAAAPALAAWTGLLETASNDEAGMPRFVAAVTGCCAASAWRAGVVATGVLSRPRARARPTGLGVECPSTAAALAMVGLARRFPGTPVPAAVLPADRHRSAPGGADAVAWVGGEENISAMLTGIGALCTAAAWIAARHDLRSHASNHAGSGRRSGLNQGNVDRSRQAAASAIGRLDRALRAFEQAGVAAPDNLMIEGQARLRIAHPGLSLDQLAQLADPPVTKDAMAGRIRRLISLAEKLAPPADGVLTNLN